jgi:antitoxin PrlF
MAGGKGSEKSKCCGPEGMKRGSMMGRMSCCKIEAVVSVDERGQLVLPKEIRDKAGIKAGDKLALIMHGSGEEACCISLIKTEGLADGVRTMLGPMMKDILG